MAEATRKGRIVALDYLRGFVIVLVVLHHSVLAYMRLGYFDRHHFLWSTAPIVDDAKWRGFDLIAQFNDAWFMAAMFLLSGLFVWPDITRRGRLAFCRARLLRLGLPYAVASLTLMPLAYYPSFLMTGADSGFSSFWLLTVFTGPWPSGPAWFIGVLLAFDLAAAAAYGVIRRRDDAAQALPRPWSCFGWLIAFSAVVYLPALLLFGPNYWFTFGPFAIQASRVGLYGVYFLAGITAGYLGLGRILAGFGAALRQRWLAWSVLALLVFAVLVVVQIARLLVWPGLYPLLGLGVFGCLLLLFCAATTFAGFAICLRFFRGAIGWMDNLAANAYGIYLVHFPVVTWAQYALLDRHIGAMIKATLVFSVALSVSWVGTMVLRRLPGAARVI